MRGATAELWETPVAQAINLYPWQLEAVEALRQNIRAGVKCQILSAPTGSGKTTIASYLIDECERKGKRAVFVCDRIPLINQTSETFDRFGIDHGVIQASHWRDRPWKRVQIASAQTLANRGWPEADLIVVDEAHTIHSSVTSRIARRDCVVVGLTATPFSRGLGLHYQAVVNVRTLNQLTAEGYLVPFRVFSPSEPDMKGVSVSKDGEWSKREATQRALPIVGDLVSEYLRHAAGRHFIAFGVTIAHCEEIRRQFMAAGVNCGLYTADTPDAEREQLLRDFRPGGHVQGLVSVGALAKGFDAPWVDVVIMARPLRKSLAEHIQILGRGLRRDPDNPGKECLVLDHAGNMLRFWADMMDFFEHGATELDDGRRKESKKAEAKEREPMKCPRCAHVHDPRPMCPSCGHEYPKRSSVEHVPGTLSELTGHEAGSRDDRQAFYSQLLGIAHQRGYQEGWAGHKYRERYGSWPNGLVKQPAPPTAQTVAWVKSRIIAWSRAKAKAVA